MTINIEAYLERIHFQGPRTVSVETFKKIHSAQVFAIPFENLAIHQLSNEDDDIIKLDEQSLFKKLVTEKRGGYCHENNELLALALIQLGFKVDRLLARVLTGPQPLPKGHKLLLITIDEERWIADVGFGGNGLIEPIPLLEDIEFIQYSECFKLIKEDENYILQAKVKDEWSNLYSFPLVYYQPIDYELLNYAISHRSNSIFVKNRMCVLPTLEGRIILNNLDLKIRKHGKNTTFTLQEGIEYLKALKKYFGIELPEITKFKKLIITDTHRQIEVSQIRLGFMKDSITINSLENNKANDEQPLKLSNS